MEKTLTAQELRNLKKRANFLKILLRGKEKASFLLDTQFKILKMFHSEELSIKEISDRTGLYPQRVAFHLDKAERRFIRMIFHSLETEQEYSNSLTENRRMIQKLELENKTLKNIILDITKNVTPEKMESVNDFIEIQTIPLMSKNIAWDLDYDVDFSSRLIGVFRVRGIKNVLELFNYDIEKLKKTPGIGKGALYEIINFFEKNGIDFINKKFIKNNSNISE